MVDTKVTLLKKFAHKEATIGIVGLGYVGLPLGVAFAQFGFSVVGIDVDETKVDSLNRGKSYVEDVPSAEVAALIEAGLFRASADYADLADVDAISICVPTPLNKTGDPDVGYIIDAADKISAVGARGKLIVLESTTYPGTTEEVILPRVAASGGTVGEDLFVAFSPERIDPGRTDYTMFTTPKVIGGVTADCLEVGLALYRTVVNKPVPVSSTASAEMVKLLENTFRAVNIGLANEIAIMCDKLGINVWEVIAAAETKPYGFMKFTPGPGLGGHCIPVDPHYLSWKLRSLNYKARFIELASEINSFMPEYVVSKIADALNSQSKSVRGSAILILGVAYKPNVSDVRESPALDIMHLLQQKGADISYIDPHVPSVEDLALRLTGVEMHDELLNSADCVVVITNHAEFDWERIANQSQLIVDTRNAIPASSASAKVITLAG